MVLSDDKEKEIEKKINYTFQDKALLNLAFIHRSYLNENRDEVKAHNERLEFLGDTVLGIIVSEYLYKKYPERPEGELSTMRAQLVESHACMTYIRDLDVEKYVALGKGERDNAGRGRESILADLFEALLGAIYLDGGLEASRHFLMKHCSSLMEEHLEKPYRNWKALLQDYAQKNLQDTPHYEVLGEEGPDHCKTFEVAVIVCNKEWGRGSGSSKKEAQQNAAEAAMNLKGIEYE